MACARSRTSISRWPQCSRNLAQVKAERALWERRVALLRSDRLDPDMLDERARALLGYVDPRDLTLLTRARATSGGRGAGVIHRSP